MYGVLVLFHFSRCISHVVGSGSKAQDIAFILKEHENSIETKGDIKVSLVDTNLAGGQDEVLSFWLHSTFMGSNYSAHSDFLRVYGHEMDPAREVFLGFNDSCCALVVGVYGC